MIRNTLLILVVLVCTALSVFAVGQNLNTSADGIWQEIDDAALKQKQSQRPIIPDVYRTFTLNMDALKQLLSQAPMEFTEASRNKQVIMTLPLPDGTFGRFRIEESPVMEAGLAVQYPEIRTYRAQGIDDPTATMRFDLMPTGFHAMVLSARGSIYVDPYAKGDTRNYIVYYKKDLSRDGRNWECGFVDPNDGREEPDAQSPEPAPVINGSTLRTYRLALAATNEYAVAVGGNTVAGSLAAQVLVMNRVNGVYEREVAIRMVIIANNNLIVYAADRPGGCAGVACTGANDPYTNSSGSTMLGENQANLDAVILTANYDIGHVFSTGGGGVATLNSPCNAATKARGVTGLPTPVGDPFAIDFVAHEMGHQYGGLHTFNGITGNCGGGNRSASAAYEPGSGITIMAYAGICGAQDLAANSIDTFSVKSLEQIVAFREAGGACAPATATGNTPPVPTGPGNFTIPKGTPFSLTASATDVNGDSLTYDWNEYDLGAASPPDTDADGQARPIFRQYLPTVGGTRMFPSLTYILNNANIPPATTGGFLTGEILPSISRTMTFQVVVRDNRANGGGINTATSVVTVDGVSGPFAVTAPNTAVSFAGGSSQTVSWNVAGTTAAPVSAANVSILLSTNGGSTFPTTILASTPNDGSQVVTIPNVPTAAARIKVQGAGNIFFDVSNVNFTITPGVSPGQKAVLDFDGDNRTDYAVVRDVAGTLNWFVQRSALGFTGSAFGSTGDQLVPGDYDGDLKWDVAVWRAGTFYIFRSMTGTVQITPFGAAGDDARITQDYDGDGKADPAVARNVGGALTFYILRSMLGFTGVTFGNATTDAAIRGDWDGDGKADVAVYRVNTGVPANTFFVLRSSDGGVQAATFGTFSTDYILPADFDGDGKTDYAVWRGFGTGTPGTWYWLQSSDGGFRALNFGVGGVFGVGDQPVPGDYDGDGKTDQAVWRPAAPSTFYVNRSMLGFTGFGFGVSTDVPPAFSLQAR